mgnify:CR=1 FL=1
MDYIFVASDSVPKLLEIAKDNIIERCNKNDCGRKSKIMKIMKKNHELMVGVDNHQKLFAWYYEED